MFGVWGSKQNSLGDPSHRGCVANSEQVALFPCLPEAQHPNSAKQELETSEHQHWRDSPSLSSRLPQAPPDVTQHRGLPCCLGGQPEVMQLLSQDCKLQVVGVTMRTEQPMHGLRRLAGLQARPGCGARSLRTAEPLLAHGAGLTPAGQAASLG